MKHFESAQQAQRFARIMISWQISFAALPTSLPQLIAHHELRSFTSRPRRPVWRVPDLIILKGKPLSSCYRDGLGDLELCRRLTRLFNPIHDCPCFNFTQAGPISRRRPPRFGQVIGGV